MIHIEIVLYKSSRFFPLLVKGFNAVAKYSKHEFTVHFLENSDEKSKELIEKEHPQFKFTHDFSGANLGSAGGNNMIFDLYGETYGDEFIIMNPDTIPYYNFLDELVSFKNKITDKWGTIEICQFPAEHPKYIRDNFSTDWASGASYMTKTKLFKELGGLDKNIFMYCDDVDYSWRVREGGFEILHCPDAKVCHITQGLDIDKDPTFEITNSYFGNMYLRYKFFQEAELNKYLALIKDSKYYNEAYKLFKTAIKGLSDADLIKYRNMKTPKIYNNGEYAKHRW